MDLSVDIEKKLDSFTLRVKLDTREGVLALLGASGCGKSMTLKCIAGIERPDRGRIVLNGRVLFDSESRINLSPQKRKAGYLFQEFALFPNMTVEKNIACAVRDRADRESIVRDMIRATRLEGLEKRKPHELSGGEKQRTALARILASGPEALLLDEPFSSLDSHLRLSLEAETAGVIGRLNIPVIIVSHDCGEAFRMSSHIALMHDGVIEMTGPKNEVYEAPATVSCARLLGITNIYEASVTGDCRVHIPALGITAVTSRVSGGQSPASLSPVGAQADQPETTESGVSAGNVRSGLTHVGIRASRIKVIEESTEEPGDSTDSTAGDACEAAVGQNIFTCDTVRAVENPDSFTLLLKPSKEASETISAEVGKDRWAGPHERVRIYIPPESVIPLEG